MEVGSMTHRGVFAWREFLFMSRFLEHLVLFGWLLSKGVGYGSFSLSYYKTSWEYGFVIMNQLTQVLLGLGKKKLLGSFFFCFSATTEKECSRKLQQQADSDTTPTAADHRWWWLRWSSVGWPDEEICFQPQLCLVPRYTQSNRVSFRFPRRIVVLLLGRYPKYQYHFLRETS